MYSKKIFIVLLIVSRFLLFSNESNIIKRTGLKYYHNYPLSQNQSQNWGIAQDGKGLIYSANQGCVLEFDGIQWRNIPSPIREVRSIAVAESGTLFVGGLRELGFFDNGPLGSLKYNSLISYIPREYRDFKKIQKVACTGEYVYFWDTHIIFRWSIVEKKFKIWTARFDSEFLAFFICGKDIYVREKDIGLSKFHKDKLTLLPQGKFFADKSIFMLVPYDDKDRSILVGTRNNGFFLLQSSSISPFVTQLDEYVLTNQLYCGLRLKNGQFAAGTRMGGMVIFNQKGELEYLFDTESGLQNNNVKFIFEDFQGNIWLALEKGIAKLEYSVPMTLLDKRSGLPGLVLAVCRLKKELYAGTTLGLYRLTLGRSRFKVVDGFTANCWALIELKGKLLVATSKGGFVMEKGHLKQLFDFPSYSLFSSQFDNETVWAGTKSGFLKIKQINQTWRIEKSAEGIPHDIYSLAEDSDGNLWLGTLDSTVYKVRSPNIESKRTINSFTSFHGLPGGEIFVAGFSGNVVFATEKGVYQYNKNRQLFIPDSIFGKKHAGKGQGVFRVSRDWNGSYWFHNRGENFVTLNNQGTRSADTPYWLRRVPKVQVNVIYPDPYLKTIWLGSHEGLICYNHIPQLPSESPFWCQIREVRINRENIVFKGHTDVSDITQAHRMPLVLTTQSRGLYDFTCAAPFYQGEGSTLYRYWLEGHDKRWSSWSKNNRKSYTILKAGLYRFRAMAYNIYKQTSKEAVIEFRIPVPWYGTWWAIIIYSGMFFLVVFFIVKWRSHRLLQEKQNLESIVAERTMEINEKNKQLKEMDGIKSRFFANISHEFRTPLTIIMGPLEQMLSDKNRNNQEKREMQVMLRSSRKLLCLINQLLDLSKLDYGKLMLHARLIDIILFLKGLVSSFQLMANNEKLHIDFITDVQEFFLYIDPEKMEQAIGNLLANAIKFTPPEGMVTLSFKVGNPVLIIVKDTGIGIASNSLIHIFDRFYRVEEAFPASTTISAGGTGIGLALAKELIELHHGEIAVSSQVGKGTEFIITLPCGKNHLTEDEIVDASNTIIIGSCLDSASAIQPNNCGDEEDGAPEDVKETIAQENDQTIILVVDDNKELRDYIRRSLRVDYEVVEAANGSEGIEKAVEYIPDLIVSDVMMPGVDGFQLCQILKQDIKTSHIPIILLTARASEENVIEGFETGADDYITKPFNTNILLARIKNLINLRKQLQEKIQRQLRLEPETIAVPSLDETFLKELQDKVEKNLSDPDFNVEKLSQLMYMARISIYRKVLALTGESPTYFIRSYRLKRAAQLLKANFGNVTDVAMEVGFSSTAYFTKCFKEKFHRLPSSFIVTQH